MVWQRIPICHLLIVLGFLSVSDISVLRGQANRIVELPERFQARLDLTETEGDLSVLLEEYEYLRQNPLYYARLTKRKLQKIPELTPVEVDSIWAVIQNTKNVESWAELSTQLSKEIVEILAYAIVLKMERLHTGDIRWRLKQSGGSDYQLYSKSSMTGSNGFSASITTERDPGEVSLLDHWAGGIQLRERGRFPDIILGQFLIGYGQGLSYGSPMGVAKSTTAITNADRSYSRMRLNTSSLESIGFLGLAAAYNPGGGHSLQAHVAKTPRDGSYEEGQLQLSTSGLHLTESSIIKSNAILENVHGLAYEFTTETVTAGVQMSNIYYQRTGVKERVQFGNFGSIWMGSDWFGHETALDQNGKSAHYTFVRFLTEDIHWTLGHRWYNPGFISYFGNGFSEFSGTENERGVYLGAKWRHGGTAIQGYIDQFEEISSSDDPARSGTEFLFSVKQHLQQRMYLSGYFKNESKEILDKSESDGIEKTFTSVRNKNQMRLQWNYRTSEQWDIKCLVDIIRVHINEKVSNGIQWSVKSSVPVSKKSRLVLFFSPYFVEQSDASTYYFIMPVSGTMQLLRQSGRGLIIGSQFQYQFSGSSRVTLFYMGKNELSNAYSHLFAMQMDVAF